MKRLTFEWVKRAGRGRGCHTYSMAFIRHIL
jgi:hypothetical protein